jgi:hypothetical protein
VYLPPDPASRTSYVAGEIAQCDLWFPPIGLPVGFGQPAGGRRICSPAGGNCSSTWGGAVGAGLQRRSRERWRGGRGELTAACQAFRGTLGATVLVCRPADPEAKGLVERAQEYLERPFLPGRVLVSFGGLQRQLADWLAVVNTRPRRALAPRSSYAPLDQPLHW